jgi:hypothetical protein
MNITANRQSYPDHSSVPSELSFTDRWDGAAVTELIRAKSAAGSPPSFLFLGIRETQLLQQHLAECFGEEAVTTLQGTYYKGLVVVTIACEAFLSTGGRKTIRPVFETTQRPGDSEALWQFRF